MFFFSDPQTRGHPSAGRLTGPQDERGAPQRLRSAEESGVRQSQRREQSGPEELRRHPGLGPPAEEDRRCGNQRAGHRYGVRNSHLICRQLQLIFNYELVIVCERVRAECETRRCEDLALTRPQ